MKKTATIACLTLTVALLLFDTAWAGDPKLAQTGFQFLSGPTEARAAAMGDAFTAVGSGANAIFYNPANLGQLQSRIAISLSRNNWIADIEHLSGAAAFSLDRGRYGVVGVSIFAVDYGEIQGTRVDANQANGYRDTGIISPNAYAVGVSYSKALTDQFSFGFHAKYTSQDLGRGVVPDGSSQFGERIKNFSAGVMAFDFGTIYRTGFKSLAFGIAVRNFSREVTYETEGFQLPLNFRMGLSMDMMDLFSPDSEVHNFLLSVDAIHPRAAPEQLKVGAEYTFVNVIALRFGYNSNVDERDIAMGFGLKHDFGRGNRVAIDYAYTPFGIFDNVQRFSFSIAM